MKRQHRFEVVRTDAGWHARFVAANGQTVWVTESYTRRRAAERAIEVLSGEPLAYDADLTKPEGMLFANLPWAWVEVRLVDERTKP